MVGTPSPKTIRVMDQLKKRIVIMVDTGSTHNFVDTSVTSKCQLPIQTYDSIRVKIANGDTVTSTGKCSSVSLQIQGTNIYYRYFYPSIGWM